MRSFPISPGTWSQPNFSTVPVIPSIRMVTVHAPAGIAGKEGSATPFLAAAITVATNDRDDTFRFRQVSMTLASNANARVPASLLVP